MRARYWFLVVVLLGLVVVVATLLVQAKNWAYRHPRGGDMFLIKRYSFVPGPDVYQRNDAGEWEAVDDDDFLGPFLMGLVEHMESNPMPITDEEGLLFLDENMIEVRAALEGLGSPATAPPAGTPLPLGFEAIEVHADGVWFKLRHDNFAGSGSVFWLIHTDWPPGELVEDTRGNGDGHYHAKTPYDDWFLFRETY